MTPRAGETPAEIAARYGVTTRLEAVTICPPRTFAVPLAQVFRINDPERLAIVRRRQERAKRLHAAMEQEAYEQCAHERAAFEAALRRKAEVQQQRKAERDAARWRAKAEAKRALGGVTPRRAKVLRAMAALRELLLMGETAKNAARMMGLNPKVGNAYVVRMRELGWQVPDSRAAFEAACAAFRRRHEPAYREARARGLNITQAAAEAGVSYSTAHRWERS